MKVKLTNAERQSQYIARLRARAVAAPLKLSNLRREARERFLSAVMGDYYAEWVNDETFSTIIRTAVDTCGLSLMDLARLVKVSHSSVSRWCAGKNFPEYSIRRRCVELLIEEVKRLNREEKENGQKDV